MSESGFYNGKENSGLTKRHKKSKEQATYTCSENTEQYLYNSTLHGLRYVGDRNISYFERIFFGMAFIFVIFLSAYFISNIWQKWSLSPMIISLNSKSTSIGSIPFPAVTICNMNKARQIKVENIQKGSLNDFLLDGLCNKRDNLTNIKYSSNWPQFREFILNVSQPCTEMLLICKYASVMKNCMQLFDTALTDEGLCCTFNQVHRKYLIINYDPSDEWDDEIDKKDHLNPTDWTPETGFDSAEDMNNIYPRPAAGPGSQLGLTVVLNTNVRDYHCSSTNSKGFKVLLHNPTETPQIQNFGFSITPGYESRVTITPKISDASDKVRPIPQSLRKCVFSSEGNLSYFRTYSRKNCVLECQSKLVHEICGCVLYHMPRMSNETPICNREDYACYRSMIQAIELTQNDTYSCHCLPGCFELSYMAEVSVSYLGTEQFFTKSNLAKKFGATFSKENIAIMHIYYEQNFFRSNSKEEFIGFTEFLSNVGGLLGLFMGFSVVSLIEIIYFLTFRPYCNRKKSRKNKNVLNFNSRRSTPNTVIKKGFEPSRNKYFGQIKDKPLALFRPQINQVVTKSRNTLKNRNQYFE